MKKIYLFLLLMFLSLNVYAYKDTFNPATGRLDKVGADNADDLSASLCTDGQILKKTAGAWACGADSTGSGGASVNVSEDGVAVASADVINISTGLNGSNNSGVVSVSSDIGTISTPGIVSFDTTNFVDQFGRVQIKSGGVDLADEVTGTLPVANGGTGQANLNDLITLTTHTTGNYLATVASGNAILLGAYADGEGASATVSVDESRVTVTNLGSGCTDAQVLGGTSGGTGVECQTDDDVPESGDFGNAGDLEADGTISANAVALTTDTTGNYVGTLASGDGILLSGYADGEGSTATVSVDKNTLTLADLTDDVGYEEETHVSEHQENGADELLGENLGTACTNGQVLKANASGGLDCGDDSTGSGGASVNVSEDGVVVASADVINVTTGLSATNSSGVVSVSADIGTITTPGIVSFDTANFVTQLGRVQVKSGGIDLADEVTGTLPVANGGTGATTLNDLITLSTHTTGNYVASLASGDAIDLGTYTAGEGSAVTVSVEQTAITVTNLKSACTDGQVLGGTADGTGVECQTDATGGAGSSQLPPKEYWWPASALLPLEVGDSIPPISKYAGTNMDMLEVLFDSATDEGRTANFSVPASVDTSGFVLFSAKWRAPCSNCLTPPANNVVWDFRHNGGAGEGGAPDTALTTIAVTDTAQTVSSDLTVTTAQETVSTLGWTASEDVHVVVARDANNASDTVSYDAHLVGFGVTIPQT